MQKYVCIIIGAGPAGIQAGLFLGRAMVSAAVIGIPEKSDLYNGRVIGNLFSASDEPPGKTLLSNGVDQLKKYGVDLIREEVVDLEKPESGPFKIITESKKEFQADSVIIATGQAFVKAGIQGEDKFLGNGVHTCVACDGFLTKGKKIGVVGSGSHAAQEAIELLSYTNRVTIYTQGEAPGWSPELGELVTGQNISVSNKRIKKLKGEQKIEGVVFSDDSEDTLDGIFIAMGSASSLTFAYKLGLEQKDGFLVIDRDGKTNMDGVWAAGAATGGNAQIAKSIGEGCNAAINVIKKAKGLSQYMDQA